MRYAFLTLLAVLVQMVSFAQTEPEISAYPDKEGNWILYVQNPQNDDLKLRFLDEKGGLLTVRRISGEHSAVRMKIDLSQTSDSVLIVVLLKEGYPDREFLLMPQYQEQHKEGLARVSN